MNVVSHCVRALPRDAELLSFTLGTETFPSRGGRTFSALRPTTFPAGKKLATTNHFPSRD